jgi:acetylornithine deacetylase/succinyl-diaminopimelate desuccinylase-like protein
VTASVTGGIDRARIERDLRALVGIRSITGSEETVQDAVEGLMSRAGLAVERLAPNPAEIRADPDWPGEEMFRSTLPIVAGRHGRRGRRRCCSSGTLLGSDAGGPSASRRARRCR